MNSIIKVNKLEKSFGELKVLENLSFQVKKGEIFGIIGPDGAGKTTLLRILGGILEQDAGDIDIFDYKLPKDAEKVKEHIGYVPQKFSLYTDLTLEENIKFFAEIYQIKKSELEKRLDVLFKMTRLFSFKNYLAGNLSGGMKQKLALMCALIYRPEILILDEPTTGVDPVSRREFWELLQQISAEGTTILISTPYMDEAEWCTRIGLIYKGKMLVIDTPKNLKKDFKYFVLEIYFDNNKSEFLRELKNMKEILDIKVLGNKINLIVKEKETVNKIISLYKNLKIRMINPNIEDIFITKIKKEV